jgi:hypothetical protein
MSNRLSSIGNSIDARVIMSFDFSSSWGGDAAILGTDIMKTCSVSIAGNCVIDQAMMGTVCAVPQTWLCERWAE